MRDLGRPRESLDRAQRPSLRHDLRVVVRLFDPDFALRVQRGFGIRFTRSVSQLAAPAFAAAATRTEVVATVPVGDRRMALFARLRVPAGSALEGTPTAELDRAGALRVLAVADPGSDVARWDVPADEVLDAGEEVVVATTRAGLAGLLHLAANPAGSERTIADMPSVADDGRAGLPFGASEAVNAVRHGVGRVIGAIPPPFGARRVTRDTTGVDDAGATEAAIVDPVGTDGDATDAADRPPAPG